MSERRSEMFLLPDVGEGIAEARVVAWLIEEGGAVKQLQPFIEVETDKATVELTSPWNGVVARHVAKPDDWVNVGEALAEIHVDSDSGS